MTRVSVVVGLRSMCDVNCSSAITFHCLLILQKRSRPHSVSDDMKQELRFCFLFFCFLIDKAVYVMHKVYRHATFEFHSANLVRDLTIIVQVKHVVKLQTQL